MAEINFGKSTKIEITPTKRDDYNDYHKFCARQLDESRYYHERDKSKKRLLAMFAIILVVSGLAFCAFNGLIGFSVSEPEIVDEPVLVTETPPILESHPAITDTGIMENEPLGIQDSPVNVSYCGFAFSENTEYVLNLSINSSGTCLNIMANNVTLDCQGKNITYAEQQTGFGINVTYYNYTTIKNCNINQYNSSNSGSDGIYLYVSSYNNVLNNNISINSSSSNFINLYGTGSAALSAYNSLISNTLKGSMSARCINLNWASHNNISLNNISDIPSQGLIAVRSSNNSIIGNYISSTGNGILFKTNSNNNRIIYGRLSSPENYAVVTFGSGISDAASYNTLDSAILDGGYYLSTNNYSPYNNMTNITFLAYNSTIRFLDQIEIPKNKGIIPSRFNITSNTVFLSSVQTSSNLSFLNRSAEIKMYVPGLNSPRIIADLEDDGIFDSVCSAPDCSNLSYSGGTFIFNISHFTIYKVEDSSNAPLTNFTYPTPNNGTITGAPFAEINLTVDSRDKNLDSLIFNWNGTNYSFYDSSLVLSFNFNNDSAIGENDTYAVDNSKYSNNGVIENATIVSGVFGSAMDTGESGYARVTNSTSINMDSNFTFEAWVYPRKAADVSCGPGYFKRIYSQENKFEIARHCVDGGLNIYFPDEWRSTSYLLNSNTWYHIAVVSNDSYLSLYVNGNRVWNTSQYDYSPQPISGNITLGSDIPGTEVFNGTIDEVRMYNRELSAEEISKHYKSELSRQGISNFSLYVNITGLNNGTYDYYAWANDTLGGSNSSGKRTLTVSIGAGSPETASTISFISPTPANGTLWSGKLLPVLVEIGKNDYDNYSYYLYNSSGLIENSERYYQEESRISTDLGHKCIVLNNGNITCYGNNQFNETNNYTGGNAIQVSAGGYSEGYTCALLNNGNTACWGDNGDNQLVNYTGGDAIEVSTGSGHTCILLKNGNVNCWGIDYWTGKTNSYLNGDAIRLSVGGSHNCVLLRNGNITCWGVNNFGQAGNYTGGNAIGVSSGLFHNCALLNNGNIDCWGDNGYGEANDYTAGDAIGVSSGYEHTCALLRNGNVTCWGHNTAGETKNYTGGNAIGISSGEYFSCALLNNGNVTCWGGNSFNQTNNYTEGNAIKREVYAFSTFNDGNYSINASVCDLAGCNWTETRIFLVDIPPVITINSPSKPRYTNKTIEFNISLNKDGNWCGLSLDGSDNVTMTPVSSSSFYYSNSTMTDGNHDADFSCNDTIGIMGYASASFSVDTVFPLIWFIPPTPQNASNLTEGAFSAFVGVDGDYQNYTYNLVNSSGYLETLDHHPEDMRISSGDTSSCVLLNNGNVTCWGENMGNYTGGNAIGISSGFIQTCALLNNGNIDCWGSMNGGDYYGEDAIGVSAGYTDTCVLLKNGNATCYGTGFMNGKNYIGGNAVQISTGYNDACVLLDNGNVTCWGDNTNNKSRNYTGGDAIGVASGWYHNCALLRNGNVTCWGLNSFGQSSNYTGGNAIRLSAGSFHNCVLLSAGNVTCWGLNNHGQSNNYTLGNAIGVSAGGDLDSPDPHHTCILRKNGNVTCWGWIADATQPGDYTQGDVRMSEPYSFQFLENGTYYLNANACDDYNNCNSTETRTINVSIMDVKNPGSISGLRNYSAVNSIYWNWTNPGDSDFNSTIIFIDGNNTVNLTKPLNYYNATGLICNTTHNLTVWTKDNAGNVNDTGVFNESRTLDCPDATIPGSITGLKAWQSITSIYWNWTNPSDPDFDSAIILFDGNNTINITLNHYTAAGLICNTTHNLTVWTKDSTGNVNNTDVFNQSRTLDCPPPIIQHLDLIYPTPENNSLLNRKLIPVFADGERYFNHTYYVMDGSGTLINSPYYPEESRISARGDKTQILFSNGNVSCGGGSYPNECTTYASNNTIALTNGLYHTCALSKNGNVSCKGYNDNNQATNYTGGDAIQISSGYNHNCVLLKNGNVKCWGTYDPVKTRNYTSGDAIGVSCGADYTCVLFNNGNVTCAGSFWPDFGQAANYTGGNAVQISAGINHTCALLNNGNVTCWGGNSFGKADNYSGGNAVQISAGRDHTCALLNNGNVTCWGNDSLSQMFNYGLGDAIGVSAGIKHTCVLLKNGNVLCRGYYLLGGATLANHTGGEAKTQEIRAFLPPNEGTYHVNASAYDPLGIINWTETRTINIDTTMNSTITDLNSYAGFTWIYWNWTNPQNADFNSTIVFLDGVNVANLSKPLNYYNATGFSCSGQHNLMLWTKDDVGNINSTNVSNQSSTLSCSLIPIPFIYPTPEDNSVLSKNFFMALFDLEGATGYNHSYYLTNPSGNTNNDRLLLEESRLSTAYDRSCTILADGNMTCWGSGNAAALKNYTGGGIIGIGSGSNHNCVLLKNGNASCWGQDNGGSTLNYTQGNAIRISVGDDHNCVLLNNGNITCWGADSYGNTKNYTKGDAMGVSAASFHTCALLIDGNIACWGWNNWNQSNNYTQGDAIGVSAGYEHTCALLRNGNISCWGLGNYNQSNNYTQGDAIQAAVGLYYTCALLRNGNVTCWGRNNFGQSPNYTGGDAIGISAGDYHSCILLKNGNITCRGYATGNANKNYSGGYAMKTEMHLFPFLNNGLNSLNASACDINNVCRWTETRTLNVSVPDLTAPRWQDNQTNAIYSYNGTISVFRIKWTDNNAVDSAWFESNFSGVAQNYSMNNIGGDVYNFSAVIPAGTFYWRSWANDTSGRVNISDAWTFTVNKGNNSLTVLINGESFNETVTWPQEINVTAYAGIGTVSMDRQSVSADSENGKNVSLAAGSYIYRINVTGNQNYSNVPYTYWNVTVNKANSRVNLTLGENERNSSVETNANIDLNCSLIAPSSGALNLIVNNNLINSGNSPIGNTTSFAAPGTNNITCTHAGNDNYSSSSETWFLKATPTKPYVYFVDPTPQNNAALDINILPVLIQADSPYYKNYSYNLHNSTGFASNDRFIKEDARISAANIDTCALLNNGNITCWGDNSDGKAKSYGNGDAISVSAGYVHTCILLGNGNALCQGTNDDGEANNYTGGNAIGISVGMFYSCALINNGNVTCWGRNQLGQSNNYTEGNAIGVSAGGGHACALLNNGNVTCWGYNSNGQANNYTWGNAIGVSTGDYFTCALLNNGNITCWGKNTYGEVQNYTSGNAIGVSAGSNHVCALMKSGNISCWGYDNYNQAKNYTRGDAIGISAGNLHTCALLSNGNVTCWGYNNLGQAANYSQGNAKKQSFYAFQFLENGIYHLNATACDIYDGCSSTETRMFSLGVESPLAGTSPENFTARLSSNKQDVTLNWSMVPDADGYIIFYDDNVTKIQMLNSSDHSGTSNMTLIGSSNNSWIDKTANTTQRRFYALAAYKSSTLNFTENRTGKFDLSIHNETGGVGQTMLSVPLIDYSSLNNIISNTNDWAMVYSVNDTGNEEWLYSHFETGAWQGTITSLEQGKGYYFDNFNEDTNITNVGIVPTGNVTQTIRNETGEIGQTLLGVSLKSESLQSLVPNTNDWSMVYTVNDNENEGWNLAYYESGSSGWHGAINALQPGKGYYFDNFNEDRNMTYWRNPY